MSLLGCQWRSYFQGTRVSAEESQGQVPAQRCLDAVGSGAAVLGPVILSTQLKCPLLRSPSLTTDLKLTISPLPIMFPLSTLLYFLPGWKCTCLLPISVTGM